MMKTRGAAAQFHKRLVTIAVRKSDRIVILKTSAVRKFDRTVVSKILFTLVFYYKNLTALVF